MRTCRYSKTKSGEWVVIGPTDKIRAGATVEVLTKSGKVKTESILSIGNPYTDADGDELVYGYTGKRAPGRKGKGIGTTPAAQAPASAPAVCQCGHELESGEITDGECWECGAKVLDDVDHAVLIAQAAADLSGVLSAEARMVLAGVLDRIIDWEDQRMNADMARLAHDAAKVRAQQVLMLQSLKAAVSGSR